jgi:hypothetical protein
MWATMRKIRYEKPVIADYGSIADHTLAAAKTGTRADLFNMPAISF